MKPLFVFDTEDDSKGNVLIINAYDGKEHTTFYHASAFRDWLKALKPKAHFWAVNLEYDMVNIFKDDFDDFPKKIHFGKSRLVSFMYRAHLFYDTWNHWKASVKTMSGIVGGKKLPLIQDNQKALLARCREDCRITWNFVNEMTKRTVKLVSKLRSTAPSTALLAFQESSGFKYRYLPLEHTEYIKEAYFGGRSECFRIGSIDAMTPERIFYVDINSMYPSVMIEPFPYPYFYSSKPNLARCGVTRCSVLSRGRFPVLPVRYNGKLVFPQGKFTGTWTNEELNYALLNGTEILKVHSGIHYHEMIDPFSAFINHIYAERCKTDDKLMRDVYKLMMNSLYGKFGQGRERRKMTRLDEYYRNPEKFDATRIKGLYCFDSKFLIYTEIADEYPKNTVMIWASLITSRARIKLHRLIMEIYLKGGEILYCDTDSCLFKGLPGMVVSSAKLGEFKIEHEFSRLHIKLPKVYRGYMDEKIIVERVKGVPRRVQSTAFDTGRAVYEKPNRFMESMRRGLSMNKWVHTSKEIRGRYDKGKVSRTGEITPLYLDIDQLATKGL